MNKEAVQHERGPRNSTLRRQMSLYFKEQTSNPFAAAFMTPPATSSASVKPSTPTPRSPSPPKTSTPSRIPPQMPMVNIEPVSSIASSPVLLPPPPPPPPFFMDPRVMAAAVARFPPIAAASSSPVSGLLMPTPKYPHELSGSPPTLPAQAVPSPIAASAADSLSETAARLLFMNVRWAQHVPAFTSLPYRDQMSLLEETWRELFALSAAQFSLPVELALLSTSPSNEALNTLTELKAFQETIGKFQAMGVDATEFACLRAIVLLRTTLSESRELRDLAAVSALQDQAQLTLSQYILKAYPGQPQRFGKLLLLLPSLRSSISPSTIHDVFFKCVGPIPLEKIICDMFKARAL